MIRNETRGTVLADTVRWATTPWTRLVGLMGSATLPLGDGLVLPGVKWVHTCYVRFALDLVFYDRASVVVGVTHALPPWRLSVYVRGAAGVIELPAGSVRAARTEVGDQLTIARRGPVPLGAPS